MNEYINQAIEENSRYKQELETIRVNFNEKESAYQNELNDLRGKCNEQYSGELDMLRTQNQVLKDNLTQLCEQLEIIKREQIEKDRLIQQLTQSRTPFFPTSTVSPPSQQIATGDRQDAYLRAGCDLKAEELVPTEDADQQAGDIQNPEDRLQH